jgi:aspartate racemase
MKTVGIIGGIGPESTIEYYRFIIEGYRARQSGTGVPPVDSQAQDAHATNYPSIIINSVDLSRLIAWINAGDRPYGLSRRRDNSQMPEPTGVAANTPHIIFDQIRDGRGCR